MDGTTPWDLGRKVPTQAQTADQTLMEYLNVWAYKITQSRDTRMDKLFRDSQNEKQAIRDRRTSTHTFKSNNMEAVEETR